MAPNSVLSLGITLGLNALFASNIAFAQATAPVLYDSCPEKITHPKDSNTLAYRSRDCKTVYVLPPVVGQTSVTGFKPSKNLKSCSDFKSSQNKANNEMNEIAKTMLEMSEIDFDSPQQKELDEKLKQHQANWENYSLRYNKVDAGLLEIIFEGGVSKSLLEEYRRLNSKLVIDHDIKFQSAPVAQSFLSYIPVRNGDLKQPAALDSFILGKQIEGQESTVAADELISTGSMKGYVQLSMAGACHFVDTKNGIATFRLNDPAVQNMTTHLIANLTYFVSVQTANSSTPNQPLAHNVIFEVKPALK